MKTIKVFVKKVHKPIELQEINNSLKGHQEVVGGHLEAIRLGTVGKNHLVVFLNEEGKLMNMEPNLVFEDRYDFIVGDVFFALVDNNGDTISIPDEDIPAVLKLINNTFEMI